MTAADDTGRIGEALRRLHAAAAGHAPSPIERELERVEAIYRAALAELRREYAGILGLPARLGPPLPPNVVSLAAARRQRSNEH